VRVLPPSVVVAVGINLMGNPGGRQTDVARLPTKVYEHWPMKCLSSTTHHTAGFPS